MKTKSAFSLIEVAMAISLTGFCLTVLVGLLPVGLTSTTASINQTVANGILTSVCADLRSTPVSSGTSQQYSITIPLNAGTASQAAIYFTRDGQVTALASQSQYRLTVNYPVASGSSAITATLMNLQVSWPAVVPPGQAAGSVQTFVAIDRN